MSKKEFTVFLGILVIGVFFFSHRLNFTGRDRWDFVTAMFIAGSLGSFLTSFIIHRIYKKRISAGNK